ncbi:nitrate reductase [Hibiscus syriacus]|uniref:Nitrate reductase n=1 Tax=Hibiscus syriacus TaxID=106335 RepID=A0A6A2YVX8_HIBSY|nr:nitrate reductase [Hibiscus syriacus]
MAKVSKVRKSDSRQKKVNPYIWPSYPKKAGKGTQQKKCSKASEKKDWETAKCSVCLEFPHNAVLLLCSSYDKGCRPYMCATSRRFSNCLEQYKKAYTTVTSVDSGSTDNSGWTVVEPVRKYLNRKKRSCLQDKCSFVGTYKELKKHVKAKHPLARPREVDPVLEEKWKKLENERARDDVISTIMSSTPGAVVLGDYVLEPGSRGVFRDEYDSDDSFDDGFLHLDSSVRLHSRFMDYDLFDDGGFGMHRAFRAVSPAARSRPSRLLGSLGLRRIPWARGHNRSR